MKFIFISIFPVHQYPDAAAPYLREELVLLRLGVSIVDECDLLLRDAAGDQLLLEVIVDVEALVLSGGREVAEDKLRQPLFLCVIPDFIDVLHTGIDLAAWLVGQQRVDQTLIQPDLPSVRGDLQHVVLRRLHLLVVDSYLTVSVGTISIKAVTICGASFPTSMPCHGCDR